MNPDQIVAAINSVKGQAFALGPDGESRPLTDGAPLYDGEILVADPDSQVEVAHEDGSPPYQVDGPMQLAMSDVPMADEAEITPEALEELLNNFDPPEFGGGGGSRPHNLVMLERILEPVEPATNEYDTTPLRGEGPYDWFNLSLSLGSGGGGGGGTPPQPSPQALDDYYQVREGSFTTPTALVGSVLQNDDGNTVIMIRLNGVEYNVPAGADGLTFWTALGGGVLITQDGHFVYAAPVVDNSNGPVIDSFEYCSTMDANGNPIWTTVHIDITDTIPVAVDDFYGEESFGPGVRFSANVMDNDDPSLDGVNYVWKVRQGDGETEFSVPQHSGMMPVLITANGGAVWINQDGSFSYQPSTSFMGEDTFQYQLNDSDGSPSNWATVTFNVPGPPVPPSLQASDDYYEVTEGTFTTPTTLVSSILANDDPGLVAKIRLNGVEHDVPAGADGLTFWTALGGGVLITQDGHFVYAAPVVDNSNGPVPDSFEYCIQDANGNLSNWATVNINITDTIPIAVDDVYGEESFGPGVRFGANVMDNDDPSLDGVNYVWKVRQGDGETEFSVPSQSGMMPVLITANGGAVWINQDGSFSYQPSTSFMGEDTFQYQLNDSDGSPSNWATVTFNVPGPPVPPSLQAADDYYEVTEGSFTTPTTLVGSVLANDDAGMVAKVRLNGVEYDVPAGTEGLTFWTALGGGVLITQDGHFVYAAPVVDNSNGPVPDSFEYCIQDANGNLSNWATVNINITDTIPIAVDDVYGEESFGPGVRFEANVMDNDTPSLDGDNVVWKVRQGDGETEFSVPSQSGMMPVLITANGGALWINQDGSFSYQPSTSFMGEDTFQYQLNDSDGSPSNWATVTFNVPGPPVPPIGLQAADDYYEVTEGSFTTPTTLVGSILANDDPGTVAKIRLDGVEYDVPAGTEGLTFWTALGGGVLITQDGHFVYAAPVVDNSNGPVPDSFEYCIQDDDGNPSNWATVNINITDTIPIAVDDVYGEESFGPGVRFEANVMDNDTPSLDGDNVVWKVRQGDGETEFSVPSQSGMMPVLITANGGALWINQDGSFSYQPSTSFMGEDTFQYQLNDSDGSPSNWATVTFNVPGPPVPPIGLQASDDYYEVTEGSFTTPTTLVGSILANDDPGTVAKIRLDGVEYDVPAGTEGLTFWTALGGGVLITQDGHFVYAAPVVDNSNGPVPDSFEYCIQDDDGNLSNWATVNIDITDTIPIAVDNAYGEESFGPGVRFEANVMGNDTPSLDGDNVVWKVRQGDGETEFSVPSQSGMMPVLITANGGALWINQDGSFSYQPSTSFIGEDTFQYQLNDSDGSPSNWATVTFNVPGPAVPPTPTLQASDDYYEVTEGSFTTPTTLVGSVLANDDAGTVAKIRLDGVEYDVPAGTEGLTFWTALGGGILITQDGHFVYAAPVADNSNGAVTDSFEYCIQDDNGNLSNWATVSVDLEDTVPVAVNGVYGEESFGPGVRFEANVMDNDETSLDGDNVVWKVRAGDGETEFSVPDQSGMMPVLITDNGGAVWINQDGSFSYQPSTSFNGEDSFQYQLNDSDGSPSNWATVTFNVPTAPVPENLVTGGFGYDVLDGTDGMVDVFKWSLADLDGGGASVTNTLTGFNAAEGDKLDLRDLLHDGNDYLFDANHLDVSFSGSNTMIAVSPVDPAAPALNIVIEGVDLTGGYSGQDAIDQLLKNGNLVDDR